MSPDFDSFPKAISSSTTLASVSNSSFWTVRLDSLRWRRRVLIPSSDNWVSNWRSLNSSRSSSSHISLRTEMAAFFIDTGLPVPKMVISIATIYSSRCVPGMVGRGWDQKWKWPFILQLLNAHKRGKHGILRIQVSSRLSKGGLLGRGCWEGELSFIWFLVFFKSLFYFLADVPVVFNSMEVCHFGFCRMWTLVGRGG